MDSKESNWNWTLSQVDNMEHSSDNNSLLLFMNDTDLDSLNNTNNSNIPPQTSFSEPFKILLHILYNLVFVCGVVGNGLVLYVIYSVPRMKTTTNYLLANLAVGDLVISSFCVPFTYISIVFYSWVFGNTLCKLVSLFNTIGVLVSAFTLIALAIEKYIAILHPLAPRLRKSKVVWILGLIWVTACAIATPIFVVSEVVRFPPNSTNPSDSVPICGEFWGNNKHELYYSISLMMVQYFIPLGVLVYTYSRISFVVWGIQHERPSLITTGNGHREIILHRNSRSDTKSRKAVLLTLAVICGFTLAWFPYNLNYIIFRHNPEYTNEYISIACHWVAMSHSCYNPMIYVWINTSFKNAFRDVYKRIVCCVKQQAIRSSRRDRESFSTSMSTVRRWKSYRKISFTPDPLNNVVKKVNNMVVIKEET